MPEAEVRALGVKSLRYAEAPRPASSLRPGSIFLRGITPTLLKATAVPELRVVRANSGTAVGSTNGKLKAVRREY